MLNVTTVTFYPGNESSSEFLIYLLHDDLFEGEETFQLRFRLIEATGDFAPGGRLNFVYPDTNVALPLTIEDDPNDSKLIICE